MKRAILVLLATLLAILLTAEAFARLVVERHSKVQVMVNDEYGQALHLGAAGVGHRKQLLVIGNSFVGMDLDFPLLQRQVAPDWEAHRYWIYNTNYADWYYGLKNLLESGSRPDAVAVTFTILSWQAPGIRGDYSSYYLFQPRDLPAIQDELHLDNTATANLLFARYSRFYGLRSEIRKVLLHTVLPDLPRMYDLFHPTAGKPPADSEVLSVIRPRFAKMKQLAASHRVRLLLIVPPMPQPRQEFQKAIATAAAALEIPVIMPYSSADLPARVFVDDVHLAPEGATVFTSAAVPLLARALESGDEPSGLNSSDLHRNQPKPSVVGRPASFAITGRP